MKTRICLLLLLLVLLAGCKESGVPQFSADNNGYGYTNEATGIHYTALDFPYEAVKHGDAVGVYTDPKFNFTRTFYAIPGADTALFLTDDDMTVWYAGDEVIDAAAWSISRIYVCLEDAVTMELFDFTAGEDDAVIAELRGLWFEGETVSLPTERATLMRTVKLSTSAYPALYYSFYFYVYDSGEAVFYAPISGRCVSVPSSLTAQLLPDEEAT